MFVFLDAVLVRSVKLRDHSPFQALCALASYGDLDWVTKAYKSLREKWLLCWMWVSCACFLFVSLEKQYPILTLPYDAVLLVCLAKKQQKKWWGAILMAALIKRCSPPSSFAQLFLYYAYKAAFDVLLSLSTHLHLSQQDWKAWQHKCFVEFDCSVKKPTSFLYTLLCSLGESQQFWCGFCFQNFLHCNQLFFFVHHPQSTKRR